MPILSKTAIADISKENWMGISVINKHKFIVNQGNRTTVCELCYLLILV